MSWPSVKDCIDMSNDGFFFNQTLKCYLVGGGNLNGGDDNSGSLGVNLSKNLLKSNHSKITLSLKFSRGSDNAFKNSLLHSKNVSDYLHNAFE